MSLVESMSVSRYRKGWLEGSKTIAEYPKNSETLKAALSSRFSLPSRSSSRKLLPHPPQPGFQPGSPSKEGGRVRPEGPGWRPGAWEWSPGDAGHSYLLPG